MPTRSMPEITTLAEPPLYDAIGIGISKINAIATEDDRVLVTIITDGERTAHGNII